MSSDHNHGIPVRHWGGGSLIFFGSRLSDKIQSILDLDLAPLGIKLKVQSS